MERSNGLLDKVINMLNWNRSADLYMKRYMTLFNQHYDHNAEEISNKIKKPNWPPMGKYNHPL